MLQTKIKRNSNWSMFFGSFAGHISGKQIGQCHGLTAMPNIWYIKQANDIWYNQKSVSQVTQIKFAAQCRLENL